MAMAAVYTTVNGMILSETRGGTETVYVPDTLGSLVECRDASGTKTYSAEYWPYGEVQTETGTNPSSWGFVGLLGDYTDVKDNTIYFRVGIYFPEYCNFATVYHRHLDVQSDNAMSNREIPPSSSRSRLHCNLKISGTHYKSEKGSQESGLCGAESGVYKLCVIMCDDLICAALKGMAKKICQKACAKTWCKEYTEDNYIRFYKYCWNLPIDPDASDISQRCWDCCDTVCNPLPEGFKRQFCLRNCRSNCPCP